MHNQELELRISLIRGRLIRKEQLLTASQKLTVTNKKYLNNITIKLINAEQQLRESSNDPMDLIAIAEGFNKSFSEFENQIKDII
jgi:PIN domain nuclease of toxin-antitoxin system